AARTYDKKISGNTRLVVKLPQNQNNVSRLTLSGTNDFTGGLYIEQGTVRVDDYGALGTNKTIDMKHGSLMTNKTFEGYTINLVGTGNAERGAIRISGGSTFAAKITGVGSLEIVYDGACTLTNTENDYQGKTYLGNFQWRAASSSTNISGDCTLNLGASGVLPDTTEVVFGKNAEGSGTSGNIKLDLKGFNETVAGISGDSTKGVITSDTPATLTLVGNGDYTFAGKVTGSATVEKKGTGTLTISGANTGSLVVSEGTLALAGDNTGAQSITVKEGGTLVPKTEASMATTVNLQTTAFAYPDNKFTKNTKFVISESGTVISVPMTDLQSGTYFRQRFTGIEKDFQSYFTNPEPMSNMDKIANTAYLPADTATYFTEDIWGSTTGDQNNTNLLMTKIVNTTDAPITLDFAYQFHNSAYLAVTDSKGNRTVVMNWETTSAHSIDGTNYSFASSTGSYTFDPDETYTIEALIFRYNRTIGANGGGVNGFGGTLVGMGARVSGTDGEYLPLNYIGDNWTFSDGSFVTSPDASFVASNVAINAGATLLFNTQNNNFDVYSTFSGEGMLIVDPNEGYTHTYSGNIGGSLSLAKYGYGVLVLNSANDMSGTFDIQAGEVVYAQAGAMNLVSDLSINYNAQLTIDLPASDGAAGISGTAQNYGTITVTNGRFRTWGVSGDGTIVMDGGTLMNLGRTVSGAYSAETIIDNAIVIEEGKTGTFNVGWAIDGNYQDSKLQLNGALFGAGDFILETNGNAPEDIANIAPLIANFSSADFTGNVITSNVKSNANGYNLLIMGKENAFGMSVGTLQNGGNVDMNGYNQTFGGLTGAGNLINRGSTQATLTLNIPEGTTSQYDGNIGASISLVKSGDGVLVLNHANDMNGTVDIQAGEVVYAQANAMNNVTGATIAQDAQLTINLPSNTTNAGFKGVVNNNGTITLTSGRFRTFGVTGDGTIVMDGGIMMNLENAGGHTAETAISNNLIINEGKTANFNVGWDRTRYADSKLLLTGNLSGSGTFQLDTNADAPADFASIAPLVAQFASSDFTGNVVTSDGNNMLKMGKENAFGTTVGTLQNGGNVDLNGYNQTFAGLTGTGNLINTGSSEATFTINVPAGETSKYEGKVYGNANLSSGNSTADISFVKTGEGTAQFDANADELFVKDFTVSGGRLDVKEYLTGNVLVNGGVFSPGNSVGTLNVTGNVSVVNGKALFEFDSFIDNKFDVLNILGDGNSFTAGNGMIELYFGAEDPQAWAVTGAEYQIVSDEGFTAGTYDSWLSNYTNLFGLTGKADGLYLVALASPEPGTGVPEPSTWALLLLGAFGLLYFRKRK
ncbi:MAG: autotransporter-associated beta strand repeat-containing protein, partial [Thermoguttaceae bacterium]|nr:autotransporter-associated beta strand repeat-containing protein [Thermoguttaceae bacterium]